MEQTSGTKMAMDTAIHTGVSYFRLIGLLALIGRCQCISTSNCTGSHVTLSCGAMTQITVTSVLFSQSERCKGPPRGDATAVVRSDCRKWNYNFHPCTGVQDCVVKVPHVVLPACGDSDTLTISYTCVPESQVKDICARPRDLTSERGYLATPGYPSSLLPVAGGRCVTTLSVPLGRYIRVFLLDVGRYQISASRCLMTLLFRQLLPRRRTGLFPQVSLCLSNQLARNQLLLETTTNIVEVEFLSARPTATIALDKIGFLLYFESDDGNTTARSLERTTVPSRVVIPPQPRQGEPTPPGLSEADSNNEESTLTTTTPAAASAVPLRVSSTAGPVGGSRPPSVRPRLGAAPPSGRPIAGNPPSARTTARKPAPPHPRVATPPSVITPPPSAPSRVPKPPSDNPTVRTPTSARSRGRTPPSVRPGVTVPPSSAGHRSGPGRDGSDVAATRDAEPRVQPGDGEEEADENKDKSRVTPTYTPTTEKVTGVRAEVGGHKERADRGGGRNQGGDGQKNSSRQASLSRRPHHNAPLSPPTGATRQPTRPLEGDTAPGATDEDNTDNMRQGAAPEVPKDSVTASTPSETSLSPGHPYVDRPSDDRSPTQTQQVSDMGPGDPSSPPQQPPGRGAPVSTETTTAMTAGRSLLPKYRMTQSEWPPPRRPAPYDSEALPHKPTPGKMTTGTPFVGRNDGAVTQATLPSTIVLLANASVPLMNLVGPQTPRGLEVGDNIGLWADGGVYVNTLAPLNVNDSVNESVNYTDHTVVLGGGRVVGGRWNTPWAQILGGLMFGLAMALMLTIVVIMALEKQAARRKRELRINDSFDSDSHVDGGGDTTLESCAAQSTDLESLHTSSLHTKDGRSLRSFTTGGGGGGGGGAAHNKGFYHEYDDCHIPPSSSPRHHRDPWCKSHHGAETATDSAALYENVDMLNATSHHGSGGKGRHLYTTNNNNNYHHSKPGSSPPKPATRHSTLPSNGVHTPRNSSPASRQLGHTTDYRRAGPVLERARKPPRGPSRKGSLKPILSSSGESHHQGTARPTGAPPAAAAQYSTVCKVSRNPSKVGANHTGTGSTGVAVTAASGRSRPSPCDNGVSTVALRNDVIQPARARPRHRRTPSNAGDSHHGNNNVTKIVVGGNTSHQRHGYQDTVATRGGAATASGMVQHSRVIVGGDVSVGQRSVTVISLDCPRDTSSPKLMAATSTSTLALTDARHSVIYDDACTAMMRSSPPRGSSPPMAPYAAERRAGMTPSTRPSPSTAKPVLSTPLKPPIPPKPTHISRYGAQRPGSDPDELLMQENDVYST